MESQIQILPPPAQLPAIITASGHAAPERFLEFFAANIRNPNTRRAYARQVMQFLAWCEGRSVTRLADVRPLHVAAYIESMPTQPQTGADLPPGDLQECCARQCRYAVFVGFSGSLCRAACSVGP